MRLNDLFDGEPVVKLWHVTPRTSVPKIMKTGLRPRIGPRAKKAAERKQSIYTFPDSTSLVDALTNWLSDQFPETTVLSVLEITVPSEWVTHDSLRWEVRIDRHVPPEYITVLIADIDEWNGEYPSGSPPEGWYDATGELRDW